MVHPSIYCISASDRYNYGDVLFPLVAKHALESFGPVDFHNVATVASDLSAIGGLPTLGYDVLIEPHKLPSNSTLLIAGGQVLGASWMRLLGFTNPRWQKLYDQYKGTRMARRIMRQFNLTAEPYPFVPTGRHLLAENRLVYHAVGGTPPLKQPQQGDYQHSFMQAAYVSVRERVSQRAIERRLGVNATLVPDSVIIYSDIKRKAELPRQLDEPYICVQFGYEKSKGKLAIVLEQLAEVYQETGLKIALLSIGNCPGHDDEVAAEWLQKNATFPSCILKHDTLDHVTSALAHAQLFIGTSLHGAIVSLSYSNPFVAVNKKITKLDAYTKAWAPEYLQGCVAFKEIARASRVRLRQHHDYSTLIEQQKRQVMQSFQHIYTIAQQ